MKGKLFQGESGMVFGFEYIDIGDGYLGFFQLYWEFSYIELGVGRYEFE